MYELWLQNPDLPEASYPSHTVGFRLAKQGSSRKLDLAVIGLDAEAARKTRSFLYDYAWDFGQLQIADLGDVRKATPDFIIPLLRELHAAGTVPVLIGADAHLLSAQYLAFGELNRQVGLLKIDQRVALSVTEPSGAPLDAAVHREGAPVFHLAHLGAQQHLVDPRLRDLMRKRGFELYRLGEARADLGQLEPTIRDADLFALDISAVQYAEAPARPTKNPSGFTLQETGQLAYYAGYSDKLSSFGIYGLAPEGKTDTELAITAAAYAQTVWYFLYGFSQRRGDFPVTVEGMTEYVVDTKIADRLTFWKSPRTNRWWVQVPAGDYRGEARNRLIACSYQDYLRASQQGDLPPRLVSAFSRF